MPTTTRKKQQRNAPERIDESPLAGQSVEVVHGDSGEDAADKAQLSDDAAGTEPGPDEQVHEQWDEAAGDDREDEQRPAVEKQPALEDPQREVAPENTQEQDGKRTERPQRVDSEQWDDDHPTQPEATELAGGDTADQTE